MRDGREVLIGRLTLADAPVLADAFERLSEESRRLRFLGPKPTLSASELRYLTDVDGHNHEALGAIDPASGRGVAIARFVRIPEGHGGDATPPRNGDRAEVALTVADDWQGDGLGKLMLSRLADRAREEGIQHFTALVSTGNHGMQTLLSQIDSDPTIHRLGNGVAEYGIELGRKGLGRQLEHALRAAAAGQFKSPPRMWETLRSLVPLRLREDGNGPRRAGAPAARHSRRPDQVAGARRSRPEP